MYGKDYYTSDREPPQAFVRRLKQFDSTLECAWNQKRGIFEILRIKDPKTMAEFHAAKINEPYDMVLECAETMQTRILDQDGVECAMRVPKDPGDWVFRELAKRDTWRMDGGIEGAGEKFMAGIRAVDAQKDVVMGQQIMDRREEGHGALCRDLNIARARVPIGVNGTRGWRR